MTVGGGRFGAPLWTPRPQKKRRPEIAFAIKLTLILGLGSAAATALAVQKAGKLDVRLPVIGTR